MNESVNYQITATEIEGLSNELESLFQLLDIAEGDFHSKLEASVNKVKAIRADLAKVTYEENIRKAATKLGANPEVLGRILPAETNLIFDGNRIKVGDRELKTLLEQDYADFLPVLFPQSRSTLPTGGGNSRKNSHRYHSIISHFTK